MIYRLVFLSLFLSIHAWSKTPAQCNGFFSSEAKQYFQEVFFTHYTPRKCGENILNFIAYTHKKGIDLSQAHILKLTNTRYSVFGMLNAEYAREAGRINHEFPKSGLQNHPGESNWHQHIILEIEGHIYDFDFSNEPTVLTVQEYFEKMFLQEKTKAENGEFFVGRKEKLENYQVEVLPALDSYFAIQNKESYPESVKLSLGEYLKLFEHD